MQTVRGKFRCTALNGGEHAILPEANKTRTFTFDAIYDEAMPEDRRYAKYTPSGKLMITVDNPAITWELGKSYYLDITAVEDAGD